MAPRPLGEEDAAALIGVTAVLEGFLLAGELDAHLVESLNRHLERPGLVGAGAGAAELRLAMARLNHRLRYALGEYDEPPVTDAGEGELSFGFATESAAQAFAEAARARGDRAEAPIPVDGRAYDGQVSRQVAVRTAQLPLSAAFDEHLVRLTTLAAEHGGSYGGWGSRA
jgi:hypothetical protein